MTFSIQWAEAGAAIHGILLALGLILPLGVQNVFIFQQGASCPSLWRAFPAVITAALCDTLLIILAVTGASMALLAHAWLTALLMAAGSMFLMAMAWRTWRDSSKPGPQIQAEAYSWPRQVAFAASVSLLNPHAIMDTLGVIGTSSLQYGGAQRWIFAASCIGVSWAWFFFLALAGKLAGTIDSSGRIMGFINKLSAVFIGLVGVWLLLGAYRGLLAGS